MAREDGASQWEGGGQVRHKAMRDLRLVLLLAILSVAWFLLPWNWNYSPASAQEPATTATPDPGMVTPIATATPSPSAPGRLQADEDIVGVVLPRDQRPRDNDIRFDRVSIEHGLSQSSVRCILQDRRGFMWFGTEDGLNKYDGYTFIVFRHDPQNPHSLSNNYIQCLYEDQAGLLWIGTRGGGLNRLDPKNGEITRYQHDPANSQSLGHDNVLSLYEDRSGTLWIGTDGGGLDRFDREQGLFTHYRHDPSDASSLSDNTVVAICEGRDGELWIGTGEGGLNRLETDTQQFSHYRHDPEDPQSLSSDHVTTIYRDQFGGLWIGTDDAGISRFNRAKDNFDWNQHDPEDTGSLSSNAVRAMYEDRSGVMWIGTRGGGLDRLDRERGLFIHYRTDPYDLHSLSDNDVWCVYQDRGGVLWVGTSAGGVSKSNRANQKFVHYHHDPNDPNSLSDNRVWSICEDDSGLLWVGTYTGGLNRLDRESGEWVHYEHDPSDPDSLSHNTVRSIYQDKKGFLWIGTDAGLDRLNPETGRFVHYRHDPSDPHSLSNNSVGPIYEDRQGVLWVGTMGGGLHKLDRASGRFTRYQYNPHDAYSLSHNTVSSVFEAYDGVLWVGTLGGGLNRFDREHEQFTAYRHDPNDAQSLGSDMVFCIAQDSRYWMYIGTWGAGFDRFDPRTDRIIHYREKNGLPNDVVYGIVKDSAGALWMSTNRGLAQFNPLTLRFRTYDVSDGLQSNEFNSGAYYKNEDGELFFGGINGLSVFYPPGVHDNPAVPPVVITAFRKLDRAILTDITENQTIQLSYADNFIAFEFAALDYTAPQKNQYQYKLEGFDPGWVNAGTRRYQSYSNLRGGRYTFRVRGSNNDGVWNMDGIAVYINVRPPIWETWWFRAGLALLLVGIVLGGFRLRVRNIQARSLQLKALVDERTYEIQRRRLVAEGLREILVILNSNRSLEESLDYIASQAALMTGAEQAVVFQCEQSSTVPAVLGCYEQRVHSSTIEELSPSVLSWIAQSLWTGQPLAIPNLENYRASHAETPALDRHHAVLGFPLSVGGEVYGGLALFYLQPQSFSHEDLELGLTLVDQAALAIANAQLRERVEQMAAETERSRLARDLHDAVTQTLFSASLIAEVLPGLWEKDQEEAGKLLQELRQLSRGAMAEMRTLLLELRPSALIETSLADLLRQLAEAVAGRTGVPIRVAVDGQCTLPSDVHVALYRIAQEGLNNVVKHARAHNVTVSLRGFSPPRDGQTKQTRQAELQIHDDGCGFDPSNVLPNHLGLGIIRERAQAVGAVLEIASAPGEGTRITVVWKG